jgi:hypothetical protein
MMVFGALETTHDSAGRAFQVAAELTVRAYDWLGGEPQQVVPIERESADGHLVFHTAVWSMPIVLVNPSGQLVGPLI